MSTLERVIPLLVYRDIQAAHDFLVNAFGFDSGGVQYGPDGQPVHGEVTAGSDTIWLHRVATEHELDSPKTSTLASAGVYLYVSDVDAHFDHARAAGATIDSEPCDQPYGQREYGARDPEGHRWWFGTAIAKSKSTQAAD